MSRLILPLFTLVLFISACTTGKKALERGDYYNATIQAVNRLRSNPDSKKATNALRNSYPMALTYYRSRAENALQSGMPFKYTEVVGYYEQMSRLSDEISRCPAALKLFPQVGFFTSELSEYRNLAAAEQYDAALASEKLNTRLSWKDACFNYLQANRFVPGYKDVEKRLPIAKFNATLKVIVEPVPVPRMYQLTSEFFLNNVLEYLENEHPNEFVAFYTPMSAESAGISTPDQVLRMNFDAFTVGAAREKETETECRRDSVEVGSVTLPDGTVKKVFGTVKAKLTTHRRELASDGVLDLTVIDFQANRTAVQRKFSGQYTWFTEWGSFNGDERALKKEQLELCKRKPAFPPGPQELFVEFTKPIYSQVTAYLKSYYARF